MRIAAFIVVCSFALAGCEEEVVPIQKDRTTLLTEFPWKLVAEYQRVGALPTWGSNSYFPSPCEADNEYLFTASGNYQLSEGASKCLPTHPDIIYTNQWAFIQTNSISIGAVTHLIERLDDNNLVLVFPRQVGSREIQVRWILVH
jgi:hypothetical protein